MENKPFVFGVATSGDNFTDRKKETARLLSNFRHGVNTVLISPRRWGKTSLVRKVCRLAQSDRAAVAFEAKPVGRYLATVFCESYHPREKDDADKRPMGRYARLLQLQVAVPGQRHENVAADEQQDGVDCVHVYVFFRAQSYENKVVACAARAEKRRLRQLVAQFVIRLLVIKLLLNGKITIFAMG